jgi:DNA-directed RNA polymerase II subunit RPB1
LFSAAVFSEIDLMRGVSERIIFGQNVSIGTGNFKIMVDRDEVVNFQAKGKKDKE